LCIIVIIVIIFVVVAIKFALKKGQRARTVILRPVRPAPRLITKIF